MIVRGDSTLPVGLAALLLLLASFGGVPAGRAAAKEKLTVGVTSVGGGQGGFLMAQEAGFFARQGLEVDLVFFGSSTETIQAMVSGDPGVSVVAGPAPVSAVLAGADLVWIAGLVNTAPYVLVVSPDVTTPGDLKGKRLGINRLGSTAELAARFALARLGLDPRADVTFMQMGPQAARLAALAAGSIQATLIEPPATVIARKLGFRELTNVATMGLRLPHEALTTSRRFARERPETLRKLMTGIIQGTHAFKTRRDDGIQVLRKYLKTDDAEALAEAYAASARLMESKPYMPLEAVQSLLDALAAGDPRARAAKPEDFIDMRFVRELDASGFIDGLYR